MRIVTAFFSTVYGYIYKCRTLFKEKYYVSVLNLKNDSKVVYPTKIVGSEFITVGSGFYLGGNSRLEAIEYYQPSGQHFSPLVIIGNNVKIQGRCHIGSINSIVIGNGVLIGSGVFITDHSHGDGSKNEQFIDPTCRNLESKGRVIIGERTWIGEYAIILPNVSIGKNVTIGAHSVVTHDIPDNCVVAGVPAKIVREKI
ncbi:acyltransferase [Liquorilactobacillus mali]|uniref:acyltransferase n=1 Tax=Liquorilactobacillus mali TaxID=1618 RepID=UPI0002491692|nr:DapH/DapD/GlmU-related protein [Liquorilactobacillus mali]QFQ74443.1 acyltransferase [Liquorilactobacillus mali]